MSMGRESPDLDSWLAALQHRHRSTYTSTEFLKALRALSVRYVERRSELVDRSPLDSAGKRAAFAAFYAPLHFVTTQEVVRALAGAAWPPAFAKASAGLAEAPPARTRPRALIIDLGCGTGTASAAWALTQADATTARVLGVDGQPWAIAEARWNWTQLALRGEARRSDLVTEAERLLRRSSSLAHTGLIAAWSVNELDNAKRRRLLAAFIALGAAGAAVLVLEPIARSAVPWWNEWADAFARIGGRADEWKFDVALPPVLAELDAAAGFRRRGLAARSLSTGL